jgi:hypothetical protein
MQSPARSCPRFNLCAGSYCEDSPEALMAGRPEFFDSFDLVIATQARPAQPATRQLPGASRPGFAPSRLRRPSNACAGSRCRQRDAGVRLPAVLTKLCPTGRGAERRCPHPLLPCCRCAWPTWPRWTTSVAPKASSCWWRARTGWWAGCGWVQVLQLLGGCPTHDRPWHHMLPVRAKLGRCSCVSCSAVLHPLPLANGGPQIRRKWGTPIRHKWGTPNPPQMGDPKSAATRRPASQSTRWSSPSLTLK